MAIINYQFLLFSQKISDVGCYLEIEVNYIPKRGYHLEIIFLLPPFWYNRGAELYFVNNHSLCSGVHFKMKTVAATKPSTFLCIFFVQPTRYILKISELHSAGN